MVGRAGARALKGPLTLGIAASHHGAACLVRGDEVLVAVAEERLVREKHAVLDPARFLSLGYCLDAAGAAAADLDLVVACPLRCAADADRALDANPVLRSLPRAVVTHHRGHAIGAFAVSGFGDAAVLVADGMGSVASDLSAEDLASVVAPRPVPPGVREIVSIYDASPGDLRLVHAQLAAPAPPRVREGDARPRPMPFSSLGTMVQSVAQQVFGAWTDAGKVMGSLRTAGAASRPRPSSPWTRPA